MDLTAALRRILFPIVALLAALGVCAAANASDLVLVHAKIYPSPSAAPIENGTILIHDGKIAASGPASAVTIPRDAKVLDCTGLVVTAGFWNSHVHILTPDLLHADALSADQLTSQLQAMLTRWGFTTIFDVASVLQNTTRIRTRIESGEVNGPRILTVGEPFWGKGGTPIYVKDYLDSQHIVIPEVLTPDQGAQRVRDQFAAGADGVKIFANSIERDSILTMQEDLARPIVAEAHKQGRPVFAHVSNNEGISLALKIGVDILSHTTPNDEQWSPSFAKQLVSAHLAITPTLTLFDVEGKKAGAPADRIESAMELAAQQLGAFSKAGGQVLFGTDVGYIDEFDTAEEFSWMSRAGLNFQQILASLTTNPAERFGFVSHTGRVAVGMDADLVVLSQDPAKDPTAFSKVRYTIRAGKVIYSQK
jgi:imidazolonepropionase-like amidohydrolase